jgi:hypothetical protein
LNALFQEDGICMNWLCQGKHDDNTNIDVRTVVIESIDDMIHKYVNGTITIVNRIETNQPNKEYFG